jgi:hypothetical protein
MYDENEIREEIEQARAYHASAKAAYEADKSRTFAYYDMGYWLGRAHSLELLLDDDFDDDGEPE